MPTIHPKTIYTKTPKGVMEVKNKTAKLDRAAGQVFLVVDGKSTVADLLKKSGIEEKILHEALEKLRAERRDRRDPTGNVRMGISEADRSGRIVFEATGLTAASSMGR